VRDASEVIELGEVTAVPGARSPLLGLYNVRGETVSVIGLAAALDLPCEEPPPRLLLAADGERRAGLAIDRVIDVGPLPETEATDGFTFVHETTMVDGSLVGVIDVKALFDAVAGGSK
jgi:chemotaxis signal transduction protein